MATFTVTTSADSGVGSLREAIGLANANPDSDVIRFAAGLSGQTIKLTTGQLTLTNDVTIDGDVNGDDKADVVLSGNKTSRIFEQLGAGTNVTLLSLDLITGNGGSGLGGGIAAHGGTLDLIHTTVESCQAYYGAGIGAVDTVVTVTNCLVTANDAHRAGGGIHVSGGSLAVTNSTVHFNMAFDHGSGINAENSPVTIANSTVTFNLTSYTIAAGVVGDGLQPITLKNTVVAYNSGYFGYYSYWDSVDNNSGAVIAFNSAFSNTEILTTDGGGNLQNIYQMGLGPLKDNGGSVWTRLPNLGSVLVDAGSASQLPADGHDVDHDGNTAEPLPIDGNGAPRVVGASVDIGAAEYAFVVTTTADIVDENDGLLSLREALTLANGNGDADHISFAAGLAGGTITLLLGELAITNDVTINGDVDGDDKADITISGNDATRVIHVTGTGSDVRLAGLTLTHGFTTYSGGAILTGNGTNLVLTDVTVADNSAARGGGIYIDGIPGGASTLTAIDVAITDNHSTGHGGGVYADQNGTATFINATIHGNTAGGNGGGLFSYSPNSLVVKSSTITGNAASGGGGGIHQSSVSSSLVIQNSILAGNTATTSPDLVAGGSVTAGNDFFGTNVTSAIDLDQGGNIQGGGDPLLGALLDNGGTVLTRSPLDGSPVIGAGSASFLPADTFDIDHDGNTSEALPLDGRGGIRLVGGTLDIGAVEQIVNETIGGTAAADTILGGLGDDILRGRGGNDSLDGGGGTNDTADYSEATGTGVTVDLSITVAQLVSASEGSDTLTGIENLTGSALADILTGNASANRLAGAAGNDTLKGGAGNDTIDGGADADTVDYSDASAGITVDLAILTGQAVGGGRGTDTLSGIENIIGSNFNDTLKGDANANLINAGTGGDTVTGSGGNDTLIGGNGNDSLDGGANDDTVQGGVGGDTLVGGTGNDTADYSVGGGAIVNLTLAGVQSTGGGGNDSLSGIENLIGGAGNDSFIGTAGAAGANQLIGNSGADSLSGLGGNDTLLGGLGNDILQGGANDDLLNGGGGRDVYVGGTGADTFRFAALADLGIGGTRDKINDFKQVELDKIDLAGVDAITGGGDDAFAFIGATAFTNVAGQLRQFAAGATRTILEGDTNGDGVGDFQIEVVGNITFTAGDFVL